MHLPLLSMSRKVVAQKKIIYIGIMKVVTISVTLKQWSRSSCDAVEDAILNYEL